MPGSQEVILSLMEDYEVVHCVCRSGVPAIAYRKDRLAERAFSLYQLEEYCIRGLKTIVKADYMIDDYDKNLRYFEGERLLFTAPHNMNCEDYNRYDTWEDVAKFFAAQRWKWRIKLHGKNVRRIKKGRLSGYGLPFLFMFGSAYFAASLLKNAFSSFTHSSGASSAAKCPPFCITVKRFRFTFLSAHSFGVGASPGNIAPAGGRIYLPAGSQLLWVIYGVKCAWKN